MGPYSLPLAANRLLVNFDHVWPFPSETPSLLHSRLVRNPIRFPGLAPVVGVRLLKVRRIRRDVRPDISIQNVLAVVCVPAVKLAPAIPELADVRRTAHHALLAVRPIEAPLFGLRIIKA